MIAGKSRKVVLVTSCMGGGGAERIVATMAAYWSNAGHEVHVVALRADESGPAYAFPPAVRVHRMNLILEHNPVLDVRHPWRIWRLRRLLTRLRPGLVLSFIDKLNVAVLLSLAGTRIPVIATEHLVPWKNPLGAIWERLRAATYPRAWAVVSPAQAMTDWFKSHYSGKFLTLPYPAHHDPSNGEEESRTQLIFSAGRLAHEKGYDLLLSAFAGVSEKRSGWRLEIAGEGPERGVLTEQIRAFGLQSRVTMPGHVADVAARMRSAELFVLSSRQEAYPMVICEAMAAGLAIIAANCPTGPVAIIDDGEDGILVPPEDAAALGSAMIRLIDDTPQRRRLGAAARMKAPRLATAQVMIEWDQLVSDADNRRA